MINKARRSNLKKLINYYKDKRFLKQKHFNVLNNSVLLFNNDKLNQKRFKNTKSPIAGTVIESGFMSRKWEYISNSWFKDSFRKFPYAKINHWSKKENYKLKPIWQSKLYLRLSETKSFICFAGAGSGKTKGIVEPTIIANALSPTKPNLFITDPKGELSKSTFLFLKNQGYKVRILNILDEKNTDCFSPFTVLKEYIYEMTKYPLNTTNLTNEIIVKKQSIVNKIDAELENVITSLNEKADVSNESFWNKSAVLAIHNIAWLIIDDLTLEYYWWLEDNKVLDDKQKKDKFDEIFIKLSFQSINATISQFGHDGVEKYKQFYLEKYNVDIENVSNVFVNEHKGLKQWKILWRQEGNKTIVQDVIQNSTIMLQKFENALLRNLTIFNTFNLDDIYGDKKQPFALFITINNAQPETLDYVSWFINYVLMKLNTYAGKKDSKKLSKPLMCILEEIGNVPFIKALPMTVNEGRGKNIFVSLFFQTYEQYNKKYKMLPDGGDFARSCFYRLLLTNAEGYYVKELVDYAGTYKLINKKTNEAKIINRLSQNDIYSLSDYEALIFQNNINVPYLSSLVPSYLFGLTIVERLKIKLDDKLFKNKINLIYNPLADTSDWTLDEAIAINFNLEQMKDVWDLSEEKRERMIQGIEAMKLIESNRIEYWNECIYKIKALDNLINNEKNNNQTQLNESKNNKLKINNKEQKTYTTNKEIENMFKVKSEEVLNSSNPKENILEEVLKFQNEGKLTVKEKEKLNNIFLDEKPNILQIDLNDLDLNINKNLAFLMNCDTKEELSNILVPKLKNFLDFEKTINQVNSEYKNIVKRLFEFINIKEEWKKMFNQNITKEELKTLKRIINGLVMIKNIFTKEGQINSMSLQLQKKFKRNLNLVTKDYILFIWYIDQIRCLGSAPINKSTKETIKNIINDNEKFIILSGIINKEIINKVKQTINEI